MRGAALAAATDGPVPEGAIGAGSGMVTMGHKAGIGTSSRHLPGLGTVGVLLLCNFGALRDLRIGGVPVGALSWPAPPAATPPAPTLSPRAAAASASCAPTFPSTPASWLEVAKRVGLGLARVGSVAHHGSGENLCGGQHGQPPWPQRHRQGHRGTAARWVDQRRVRRRGRCRRGSGVQRPVRGRHRHRRRWPCRPRPPRAPGPPPAVPPNPVRWVRGGRFPWAGCCPAASSCWWASPRRARCANDSGSGLPAATARGTDQVRGGSEGTQRPDDHEPDLGMVKNTGGSVATLTRVGTSSRSGRRPGLDWRRGRRVARSSRTPAGRSPPRSWPGRRRRLRRSARR